MVNKNILLVILPGIAMALLVLNAYGYLSIEEKGPCITFSTAINLLDGSVIGMTKNSSIVTESQCIEYCAQSGSLADHTTTCSFSGNYGTDWTRTPNDFPEFDEYRIK